MFICKYLFEKYDEGGAASHVKRKKNKQKKGLKKSKNKYISCCCYKYANPIHTHTLPQVYSFIL